MEKNENLQAGSITPALIKRPLPTLDELYGDRGLSIALNDLNKILNSEPRRDWIEPHPLAKKAILNEAGAKIYVPCEYLTVQRIEYLLTSIFLNWNLEIKEVKILANSVCVTVRLHFRSPITGELQFQDGVGAVALQVNKDAGATDFTQIKSNAVQIGAPAAETYAFKDAAEKIGKIFGKDLNRADKVYYENLDKKFTETPLNK